MHKIITTRSNSYFILFRVPGVPNVLPSHDDSGEHRNCQGPDQRLLCHCVWCQYICGSRDPEPVDSHPQLSPETERQDTISHPGGLLLAPDVDFLSTGMLWQAYFLHLTNKRRIVVVATAVNVIFYL